MITVLGTLDPSTTDLPLYSFQVPAGFFSPAADRLEKRISLDELLDVRAPHRCVSGNLKLFVVGRQEPEER